ncbi:MAG: fatty acid--CoA ligase family protein [Actinobacteria bacterium]|nr:MAG: fatty acid--CoA ligase family protein [Actinomycetota bacterium]
MRGDLEWGTIPGLLDSAAERFGPREAVVDGDTRISFEHLRVAARHAARAAIAMGVEAGDRVAIWAPNIHEWIVAALGALTAGGVLVPINTRFKGREAGFVLQKSRARLLFTVRGFLDIDYPKLLKDAEVDTRGIDVVLLRGEAERDETDWRTFAKHGEEIEESILDKRTGEPDDLSDIIFTSGTTGQPKGVMTTHAQSLRVFEVWSDIVGLREGDRYLIVNPFFHTFGYKAGILACLMRGATIVPHAVFDAGQVMRRIGEEKITVLPGPPTLYQSILNDPARAQHDLSSLRLAVTGAAVVPVELIKRMHDELTFETILTAYGLTESTGTATMCRPDDDAETIANTSGCAIPDTEVKVVDDDGKEVARGEPGEIVVKGYNVTQGYFEEPEQTAETIRDGWLHTGDIGVMDARGYVKITDRKKDMFIVGGFNAYPAEIENELLRHDDIAQVAVVGAPEARLGEVGVAFVVPKPNRSLDPDLIGSWARSQLANYKVPRKVVVIDALPMNASGKVLKYELRKRARKLMEEG